MSGTTKSMCAVHNKSYELGKDTYAGELECLSELIEKLLLNFADFATNLRPPRSN